MITTVLSQKPPPGKNPRSWGSAFWIVLHVAFYDQLWENINVRQVHRLLPHLLPCATCRKNHNRFRKQVEGILFETPNEWVNQAHNFVNSMHNRPNYTHSQSVHRTTSLYMQPWMWVNAFFKMTAFFISHYQEHLESPLLIDSLCQLMYFDPRVKKEIEGLCRLDWKENAESKMMLLRRLHQIHQNYSNRIIVPPFSQYVRWIEEASYGDIKGF